LLLIGIDELDGMGPDCIASTGIEFNNILEIKLFLSNLKSNKLLNEFMKVSVLPFDFKKLDIFCK
tara:strand:- start:1 stop:195 length:195 start_codon:yes stop_codon:yes gene_type:complete